MAPSFQACLLFASGSKTRRPLFTDTADLAGSLVLASGARPPTREGVINYALMREPQIDDLVIHINDGDFVGWSYVSAPFREVKESPPSPGQWAGRPSYYRIELKSYQEFPRSIPLKEFVEKNRAAIQEELKEDAPKRYPFILYGEKEEVRHAQGAYLTRCTPKLYALIRTNVFGGPAGAPHKARTRATGRWR